MIEFNKPTNLNGNELIAELESAGIQVSGKPEIDENGSLLLDIDAKDVAKASQIVANHNGTDGIKPLTKEEILEKLGITADEIKLLLA